jgi:hypothetical protein
MLLTLAHALVSPGRALAFEGDGLRRNWLSLLNAFIRALTPAILAAVMLAAGAIIALAARGQFGWIAMITGFIGAVATIAVGSWQGARFATRREAAAGGCGSGEGCGGCAKVCGSSS